MLAACAPTPQAPPEPAALPPKPAVPGPPPPAAAERLRLQPARFADLPGWRQDRQGEALAAFRRSCERLTPQPADRPLSNGGAARDLAASGLAGTIGDWLPACRAAEALPTGDHAAARAFFQRWFTPYLATDNGDPEGLFTGYYEAQLNGSRTRGGPYQYPLYAPPADLVQVDLGRFDDDLAGRRLQGRVVDGRLLPYYTRAEIDGGALAGKARPLAWVDDAVDAFVLHIQGSGRVLLDDGSVMRVGFAGRNGHAYRSIGRLLIERGEMHVHEASMQRIRRWIADNPEAGSRLLTENPSYIFFRELRGPGPLGAQGAPLTPRRSLAVDKAFIPYGVPVWLDTTWPLEAERPLRRLMVAQDTGGAITGPVRGDFFWGHGPEA